MSLCTLQEREESVKQDIIACFSDLLRATVIVEGHALHSTALSRSLNDSIGLGPGGSGSTPPEGAPLTGYSVRASVMASMVAPPKLVRQRSCFDSLEVRSLC